MSRKMIETCNQCGKKEVTDLDLTMVLHEKTKMRWVTYLGKKKLICADCASELEAREKDAKKRVHALFNAECKEDTNNA